MSDENKKNGRGEAPAARRVLIVDDNKDVRATFECILRSEGFETESVGTGLEAIDKARGRFFNVILMDMRLPDINGIEAINRIAEFSGDSMVIIITAYADLESAVGALDKGVHSYLTKPVVVEHLMVVIKKALEKQDLVFENRRLIEELAKKNDELRRITGAPRTSFMDR